MKRTLILVSMFIVITILASACGLLQEPEEASSPIEATPIQAASNTSEPVAEPTDMEMEPTEVDAEPPVETEEPETDETESGQAAAGEIRIFSISQADSEVRFELDEDLRGKRITVVGVTDQVAGEIAFDLNDLSTTQVGVMQINARTLLTDNDFRNRAIQNEILDTGEFEFITFEPATIEGLPGSASVGEKITFTVEGDLTIRDITQTVTFIIVAKADSENQISGTATAVVNRADYGLNIPNVPNVANVEEEVELYIDFVAIAP